jgi:hypothetical protein
MIMLEQTRPDLFKLVDFAFGRLEPVEALRIIKFMETDPSVSRDLEFVLKLMGLFEEWAGVIPPAH